MNVVSYRPRPDDLSYTFGGRPAVESVAPGAVLELYTEDCFGGRVRGIGDLPSQVCEFPYLNPVTGPFHVEGPSPATPWPSTSSPSSPPATGRSPRRSRTSGR
ncbi:hypothetical protein GCM10027612_51440 [Microbispora bryophytorum subsp. camponoti]